MINNPPKIRHYPALEGVDTAPMIAYLQDAAHAWYERRPSQWFIARHFLGGANFDWQSTPLQALNDIFNPTHYPARNAYARHMASVVTGTLLLMALDSDRTHTFDTDNSDGYRRRYVWVN